ncbi:hypothetical protein B0H13DRAFT_1661333, partial [Mycena leptocephala]
MGVDGELASGSDHHALRWVIDYGSETVENMTGKKYNFAKIDGEKWDETYKEAINEHADRFAKLKDTASPRSSEELDEDTALILQAMSRATAKSVPELRPSKKAAEWWSPEL